MSDFKKGLLIGLLFIALLATVFGCGEAYSGSDTSPAYDILKVTYNGTDDVVCIATYDGGGRYYTGISCDWPAVQP